MRRIADFWGRHFLGCEFVVACAAGGAFVVWCERYGAWQEVEPFLQQSRSVIYGTIASILGTLFGFAITAVSIIATVADAPALRLVRQSRHYPTLWRTYVSTIRVLGASTVVSFAALIADREDRPHRYLFYAVAFLVLLTVARVWRSIWILERVIGLVGVPQERNSGRDSNDT